MRFVFVTLIRAAIMSFLYCIIMYFDSSVWSIVGSFVAMWIVGYVENKLQN